MKKVYWITLSILLFIINIFFGINYKNLKEHPFSGKLIIKNKEKNLFLPSEESSLTMIIIFSYRSSEEYMRESIWWNELYNDLTREDISIIGLVPGNEEIKNISEKYGILFPVYFDDDLLIIRRFLISITPFKIIMDKRGQLLYMAPTYTDQRSQEDFYFVVVELLRKAKMRELQEHWKK